jgi:hypothetical protein
VEMRVVFKGLMPSQEGTADKKAFYSSSPQLILTENEIWNEDIMILGSTQMLSTQHESWSHFLVHSILMNSPHVLNSFINIILVSFFAKVWWQ